MPADTFDITGLDDARSWRGRIGGIIILLGIVGAAAFASYWFFIRDSSTPAAVAKIQVATVATGNLVTSVSVTGTAQNIQSSKLTFPLAGQVASVSVVPGDKVTAGQEIARLDAKAALRAVDSAQATLDTANLKLKDLLAPPLATDLTSGQQSVIQAQQQVASAQQAVITANNSVTTAQINLTTAQTNLKNASGPPLAADVQSADAGIVSAQISLTNATNSVQSAWTALINAQRSYCQAAGVTLIVTPCYSGDIPLAQASIDGLTAYIRAPGDSGTAVNAATSAANALLSANTSYLNSQGGVTNAQNALATANLKRQTLFAPPTADALTTLNNAVQSAQIALDNAGGNARLAVSNIDSANAGLASAQARLASLSDPSVKASSIAAAEQAVKQAQQALADAQDTLTNTVLRAPFDGQVAAVALTVGDQVTAATAAATIINPDNVRVDLAVQESDLPTIKPGQLALVTFAALPGSTYVAKVISIGSSPTTTQGIVTYVVQARILRGADLQAEAANLTQITALLGSTRTGGGGGGGTRGGNGGGQGTTGGGAPDAASTAAGRSPVAGRSPAAGSTPGATSGGGQGGGGILQALNNAPNPVAGMNASVQVLEKVTPNVLLVPTTAVKRSGQQQYVNVQKDDGTLEQVNVTTSGSDSTNTGIATGLTEGQKVVTAGLPTATASVTAAAGPATPRPTAVGGVR